MLPPPWYPKPETLPGILAVIAQVTSVEVALRVGQLAGGQQKYMPLPEKVKPTTWLAKLIGLKAARMVAERCVRNGAVKGEAVVIPSGSAERTAIAVRKLWVQRGYSINQIAGELHVARSRVKELVEGWPKGNGGPPLDDVDESRCPACGRRHATKRLRLDDDRQLSFPLAGPARDVSSI